MYEIKKRRALEQYRNICGKCGKFIPYEPRYEKTGLLHMRKQRRRAAEQ